MQTIYKNRHTEYRLNCIYQNDHKYQMLFTVIDDYDGQKDESDMQIIGQHDKLVRYTIAGAVKNGATLVHMGRMLEIASHLAYQLNVIAGFSPPITSKDFMTEVTTKVDQTIQVDGFFKKFITAAKKELGVENQ